MGKEYTPKEQAASALLTEFPDAATRTLACMALNKYPGMWPSLSAARSSLNRLRGQAGDKSKQDSPHTIPARTPKEGLAMIPKAVHEYVDWGPVELSGKRTWLILPDIHIPYHDEAALEIAIDYGLRHGVDGVLLNGDAFDFYAVSRWDRDPSRIMRLAEEVYDGRMFLEFIRDTFPDARLVIKEGNHEERWEKYFWSKAPELAAMDTARWASAHNYDVEGYGFEFVGEKRPIRLGKLNVIHGHEFGFTYSPVNPAKGFYNRSQVNVLGSHQHQKSEHSETNLEGKTIGAWSTGCLCQLHPRYRPLNKWSHGFAVVYVDGDGAFEVVNRKILHGKVY